MYIWNLSLGKNCSVNSGLLFPFSDASSIEANEDMEIAYPITCGESKAILLWKKFVCPGINVKCVKVTVSVPCLSLTRSASEGKRKALI